MSVLLYCSRKKLICSLVKLGLAICSFVICWDRAACCSSSVDLLDADSSKIQEACFKYFETIQVTDVNGLELNEPGEYVIKILVKKANAERYDIQIVHPITVEE